MLAESSSEGIHDCRMPMSTVKRSFQLFVDLLVNGVLNPKVNREKRNQMPLRHL